MIHRRAFLGGAAVPLVLPAALAADAPEAKVVSAGGGRVVWVMGVMVTVKAEGRDTGGSYALFEDVVPPGLGPPPHVHTKEDETMYVLEGELDVELGGKKFRAKAGDFAHMARGVPHRFTAVGGKPARMVMTYAPAGFEQWFFEVGTPVTDPKAVAPKLSPEDARRAVEAARRYGVRFLKQ